jgi:hypothetical protein
MPHLNENRIGKYDIQLIDSRVNPAPCVPWLRHD